MMADSRLEKTVKLYIIHNAETINSQVGQERGGGGRRRKQHTILSL